MKDIIDLLNAFEKEIEANNSVVKEKFDFIRQPADASMLTAQKELNRIEPTVLDFYEAADGIEIKWNAADPALLNKEMVGQVIVKPFLQVVRDWSGVVFFDNEPSDSAIRNFFPLDFFTDEAAAGFCTKEGWRNMMYLYKFDGELIPLYVNFYSYLKLMVQAKCCIYWQYLILELLQKKENNVSRRIKENLPVLFPGFSFEGFEKMFNELRIR